MDSIRQLSNLTGRVGIFGGSFDPVHKAHLAVALAARDAWQLDSVVFIPARRNPLKDRHPVASDQQRLEMLELAVRDYPGLKVSALEIDRCGDSYTIDTLRVFRENSPDARLFLIAGADCLPDFHRWREWREILKISTLIVVGRPDSAEQPITLSADSPAELLAALPDVPVPLSVDISARQLRNDLSLGIDRSDALPPEVAEYIKAHRIYVK